MTTAVISRTSIETQAQDNILSYIDNRNYVKDPRNPNSVTKDRVFVYEFDPFNKALNFGDFPYIILEFPTVDYSNINVDGKHKNIAWKHSITVRTVRDGSGNSRNNVGRNDILSIGDDLNEMFNNATVKQELNKLGIFKLNFTKLSSDNTVINEKMLFEASYELSYMTRLEVSG